MLHAGREDDLTFRSRTTWAAAFLAVIVVGCATQQPTPRINPTMHTDSLLPNAATFTPAPLRNRIQVALNAPIAEVWALVGDHGRFPEYSAGLDRVDLKRSSNGTPTEYVCHFKPQQEGGEGVSHRELIRWYEPNRGYASSAEEPNTFGLTNALTLVTLEPTKRAR